MIDDCLINQSSSLWTGIWGISNPLQLLLFVNQILAPSHESTRRRNSYWTKQKKEQNKNNFEICIPNSPPRRLSRETSRGHFQFCAREWVDVGRSLWTLSSLPTLMAQIKPHELFLFLEWPDCFLPRPPDPHVPGPLTAYSFSFPFPSSLPSEGYPKPFQPHRWGLFYFVFAILVQEPGASCILTKQVPCR